MNITLSVDGKVAQLTSQQLGLAGQGGAGGGVGFGLSGFFVESRLKCFLIENDRFF